MDGKTSIPYPQASLGNKGCDEADRFTMGDFACFRARRGGWIVYAAVETSALNPPIACLSTKKELLAWLDENLIEDDHNDEVHQPTEGS